MEIGCDLGEHLQASERVEIGSDLHIVLQEKHFYNLSSKGSSVCMDLLCQKMVL